MELTFHKTYFGTYWLRLLEILIAKYEKNINYYEYQRKNKSINDPDQEIWFLWMPWFLKEKERGHKELIIGLYFYTWVQRPLKKCFNLILSRLHLSMDVGSKLSCNPKYIFYFGQKIHQGSLTHHELHKPNIKILTF